MTLSRTARILLAILLLAAAAFFWVNFFTQNRVIGEDPDVTPTATTPPTPDPDAPPVAEAPDAPDAPDVADAPDAADAPDVAEAPDAADAPDVADAPEVDAPVAPDVDVADEPDVQPDVDVQVDPEADPDAVPLAVDPLDAPDVDEPPVVVIDPPITVARDLEVAQFPFLVTEPPTEPEVEDPDDLAALEAERALAAARATVNPFSPIVVRRPDVPAPERDVPDAPVVTEVAVPDGPPPAPERIATPAPRPLTPAPTISRDLPAPLPTGTPLATTPGLLRETRALDAIDRPTVPPITAVRVPEEPAAEAPVESVRTTPGIVADVPALRRTEPIAEEPDPRAPEAPLVAGTDRLARYLRDNGYRFTGSVLGPVSMGVFRSNADPVPKVVALGHTLPNTEIVLTDLRGEQAELTLGDLSQILILDLRR